MQCWEKCLLKRGVAVSQQQLWQSEDEMFLHPLPVQRQHGDALRVSRQRAADVPETIEPLQQLKDLNTQDRRSAMSEEKTVWII